jgi:AcrR family transcriptional regulator
MDREVRTPQQKRSIEKKQRIIKVAYQLFNENGYYATNTSMIAKQAGISVCSIYSYFQDKKDIMLACLQENSSEINRRICEQISKLAVNSDVFSIAQGVYRAFVESHDFSKRYHDDVRSLKYTDEDIKHFFVQERQFFARTAAEQLRTCGFMFKHEKEQPFLIYSLLESLEDEIIYNKDTDLNKEIVVDECARILSSMLQKME